MGHVGAVGPWVGTVAERQFQSLAMLEDAVDGQDFRSGFVEAAGRAATAAGELHTHQSVPTLQPEDWGGGTGQWGMGGLEALHDPLQYSGGMFQEDIQVPLDSVDQDSDDVGVESGAAQTGRCPAPPDSPG